MRPLTRATLWALAAALALPGAAPAAERTFAAAAPRVAAHFEPAEAKPGQVVTLVLTVDLAPGFHTYPTTQPDPKTEDIVNRFAFPAAGPVLVVRKDVQEPPSPLKKIEKALQNGELLYYEGSATWKWPAVVHPQAAPGPVTFALNAKRTSIQACDDQGCLSGPDRPVTAAFTVLPGAAVPVENEEYRKLAEAVKLVADVPPPPKPADPPSRGDQSPAPEPERPADYRAALGGVLAKLVPTRGATAGGGPAGWGEFAAFLAAAVFWGAVTLVTPCVFPMIPITVSFFLHKKEGGPSPLVLAGVYCGTIVVVLSVAALLLLQTFQALSINPFMNFALAAVFVVFALSLFGMFELTLPAWMTGLTSAKEGRDIVGTVFMALTFTLVSFSCVAPFLGGFSGMVASGRLSWPALACGALAFSVTFAAPFFVLALFPSLLKALPKSGSWLNTVKVAMGFIEVAAALKFLRTGELMLTTRPTVFTYDLVLGLYVALAVVAGLYLLGVFRLPHDEPQEHLGVPRFLTGLGLLGLGLYLTPGLFTVDAAGTRQRPAGFLYAWVDSFLLPDPAGESFDLLATLAEAKAEKKKVFVDFTGVTCTNCRLNEQDVFPKPEVRKLLARYKVVQLYTDRVPDGRPLEEQQDEAADNKWFQDKAFKSLQLPLYVVLDPNRADGTIGFEGPYPEAKINDERAFARFLREGLEEPKKAAPLGR